MSAWRLVKTLVAGLGLTVALTGAAWADGALETGDSAPVVKVVVNGQQINFTDGAPYLDGKAQQVYVPLRSVSETLGAAVDWRAQTKTAVVRVAGQQVEMTVNKKQPLVNGRPGPVVLDAPSQLRAGHVMVPLRFVSETLGYAVDWVGEKRTAFIETPTTEPGEVPAPVTITEHLVQSITEAAEVNMRVPVLSGLPDPALEKEINAELLARAEGFRDEIIAQFAGYKEAVEKAGGQVRPFQVVAMYDDHYNQDGLLSITVSYYGFTGGAHGFTVKETLNLDVNAGKKLTMADFFAPDEDYKAIVVREIQAQIAKAFEEETEENPAIYFENAAETVAEIAADKEFYIGDGEIVVHFAQYDIAPYAVGMPEFAIPVTVMPGAGR